MLPAIQINKALLYTLNKELNIEIATIIDFYVDLSFKAYEQAKARNKSYPCMKLGGFFKDTQIFTVVEVSWWKNKTLWIDIKLPIRNYAFSANEVMNLLVDNGLFDNQYKLPDITKQDFVTSIISFENVFKRAEKQHKKKTTVTQIDVSSLNPEFLKKLNLEK